MPDITMILIQLVDKLIDTYPILGAFLMFFGILFFILELFVKATPSKEDDAKWHKFRSGYLGPFIGFCMDKVKTLFKKK